MSEIQVLSEFKNQLILFFDDLISQFPAEGDLVFLRIFFKDQYPVDQAVNTFLHQINKNDTELRTMIINRNESFFLDHDMFDGAAGKDKVSRFKKLWRSDQLDSEDKKIIWRWIDTFVFLADKFAKFKSVHK